MHVVKTFERWQQSADDCLHIFVHGNVLLPWVYYMHAFFRVVKAGRILVLTPATGHRAQRYNRSRTHASLLRDACMLIMIRKR